MQGTSRLDADRAASPVIAVVLMVAVTVVLAAVIGLYAMDYEDDVDANPQASVTFDEEGNDVEVTVDAVQRADSIEISGDCGSASMSAEVGKSTAVTCSDPGDEVTVRATYQGHSVLIKTYEFHG